ncbi:MAG TPA: alpha/beta hydrolase [Candidatus Angelobacter sp.]|nr:alpha/beta hydrolase [Candidatus Angelobacter sp.]
MLASVIVLLGSLAVVALVQFFCARADTRKFPPPGSLIKVPGGEIHVRKAGAGRPAVVLEAGIAASSLNWSLLQPQLAGFTTTYSYDRAGFGWSTSESRQCTLARMSDDLHNLVTALGVPRPYIVVAHSFGAYIVTAFAQRYGEELAGVVLVDPITPEEWIKPDREQRWKLRGGVWFSRAGGVLASLGVVRACLWLLQRGSREAPRGVLRMFGKEATVTVERILRELAKLPPDVVRVIRARWSTPKFFWTMAAYIRALPACATELKGCVIPFQVPVTVLSGAHQPPARLEEHAAIAAHSQRGKQVIADKGAHWVHLDQPELVVQAVRELAEVIRERGPFQARADLAPQRSS